MDVGLWFIHHRKVSSETNDVHTRCHNIDVDPVFHWKNR